MAKGGGRGKGRPRKNGIIAGIPQSMEKEGNLGDKSNGTVAGANEGGEKSVDNGSEGEIVNLKHVGETSEARSEGTKESELDLEIEKEEEINQIPFAKNAAPMRNRGMRLDYVAPTLKQGTPTACLVRSEIEKENLKWKKAVIMYIIGEAPTITYLSNFLKSQCNIEHDFDIFYHTEGYFVIRFATMEDRDRLLYGGHHTVANRPAIVKEWVMNFCFEKEILREIPLWIQLPNLPLNCWSNDSLSRIGSVLGKPICADECTTQQNRISYARLLIEIDVTQPLKYRVQVEGEDGQMIDQKIYYEWAPVFCHKCQQIGHVCKDTKKTPTQKVWQKRQEHNQGKEQPQEEANGQKENKDKGKTKIVEEWEQPKKPVNAIIQVGRLHIPTSNVYDIMQEGGTSEIQGLEGGGRIPLNPE